MELCQLRSPPQEPGKRKMPSPEIPEAVDFISQPLQTTAGGEGKLLDEK